MPENKTVVSQISGKFQIVIDSEKEAQIRTIQCIYSRMSVHNRKLEGRYSCNNITTTLIQISRLFILAFSPKLTITLTPIVSRSKSKWYKPQKSQKYALDSQLQVLQILTNDDEVEN